MMPNSTQNINSVEFLSFEFFSLESREKDTQAPQCTYTSSFSVLVCTYHSVYYSVPTIFVSIEALQFGSSYASIRRDSMFLGWPFEHRFPAIIAFLPHSLGQIFTVHTETASPLYPRSTPTSPKTILVSKCVLHLKQKRDFGPLGWHGGAVAGLRWSDVK